MDIERIVVGVLLVAIGLLADIFVYRRDRSFRAALFGSRGLPSFAPLFWGAGAGHILFGWGVLPDVFVLQIAVLVIGVLAHDLTLGGVAPHRSSAT